MSNPPDMQQQAFFRRRVAAGSVPFMVAYQSKRDQLARSRNKTVRVRNTPYVFNKVTRAALSAILDQPQLLVPANPQRISLVITGIVTHQINDTFNAFYSFGFPTKAAQKVGFIYGIPLPGYNLLAVLDQAAHLASVAPTNGTVSTDDLYITGTGTIGNATSLAVTAYEGVLAIEGNGLAA